MTVRIGMAAASTLALLAFGGVGRAAEFKQIGSMTIPGKQLSGFDVAWLDQKTQRLYLADRDNGQLDIFDARTDTFIGAIPGFVGPKTKNGKQDLAKSGPSGVVVEGKYAWLSDGDSAAKEVDLKAMQIVATVSTGGKSRFDEIAYDPKDGVLLGGNGDDEPPFATLISTKEHKVIAKIPFANATDGIEQPAYDSADGLFYLPIPEIDHDPKKNGLAVIDPKNGKVLKTLPVANCHPNGMVFGPGQNFLLGCNVSGKNGLPPILLVMSAPSGKVVATIQGAGGADEVTYSKKANQYYAGSSSLGGVFVVDAANNTLVTKIPAGGRAHSVAVSEESGKVFIPEINSQGGCGCVAVFSQNE